MPAEIKRIYMIGICGMGMGTLASMLKARGYQVIGSDSAIYPPMSDHLASQGICVLPGFDAANLDRAIDMVIVGNVVRRENPEALRMLDLCLPYMSMAESLEREFIGDRTSVVVAGTHGKTTTSGLIAWTLSHAGLEPGFMVGGILDNFGSSHGLPGNADSPFVTEGDEYDTAYFDKGPKFLHYRPDRLVLNNVEFDHADIFQGLDHVLWAFGRLLRGMSREQILYACIDCPNVAALIKDHGSRIVTFGLSSDADISLESLSYDEGRSIIVPLVRGAIRDEIVTPLIGEHNVRNVLAAYGVALDLGVAEERFRDAMLKFKGVARRAQVLLGGPIKVIDDFAHHPTAIRTTLEGLRSSHAGRRLLAVFEPRSATSRRSRFQEEFAGSFSAADMVFLAPVHRADELEPEQLLDLAKLAGDIESGGGICYVGRDIEGLHTRIIAEAREGDLVVFMSNGGFGGLPRMVAEALGPGEAKK